MSFRTHPRATLATLVAVAALATVAGPGVANAQKAPIPAHVGLLTYLSGNAGLYGTGRASQSGLQTAVHMINARGGVAGGHQLVIDNYDTQSNPGVLLDQARRAMADKPTVMTGHLTGGDMASIQNTLAAGKLPWINNASVASSVIQQVTTMRSQSSSNTDTGVLFVQAAKRILGGSLKGKKMAFQGFFQSPISDEIEASAKKAMKKEGGTVAMSLRDPGVIATWSSQAANIVNNNIDVVVSAHGTEAGMITMAKALNVAGFTGPFISVPSASGDAMFQGAKVPNLYALRQSVVDLTGGSPLVKEILAAKASTTRANGSAQFFATGYATGWTIAATLNKCGVPCAPDKFMKTLNGLGPVKMPNNPFLGDINFTDAYSMHYAQIWKADPKKGYSPSPIGAIVAS
ncbi:MAG: hypothetical protein JWO68_1594 [Actinomycetia bacterium]|nr:hypothetical protein [Actinomycetes bacterium]